MTTVTPPPATAPAPEGAPWHTVTLDDVFSLQHVDEHKGLTSAEADERRQRYGPNRMAEAAKEPAWRAFVRQYADPMQLVLLGAGVCSFVPLREWGTGILLLALTLFNAVIGLHQEGK